MTVYLEASALWAMYYGELGGDNVESLIEGFSCVTSEYSILELARAISKRLNIEEIGANEAEALEDFILKDINELKNGNRLKLLGVTWRVLKDAYALVGLHNLYASDALHLATAMMARAKLLVADDYHFTRLKEKIRQPVILPITTPIKRVKESVKQQGI